MRSRAVPFILFLALSACAESLHAPAPVHHLGLRGGSKTGAVLVETGDTVWNIAQRYRLSVRDIIDANDLQPPYGLAVGRRLKLPPPMEYTVGERDTLRRVANMFGIDVYRLVQANGLQEPYQIRTGQVLRLPSSASRRAEPVLARMPVVREMVPSSRPLRPAAVEVEELPVVTTTVQASKRPDFIWPVRGRVVSGYGAKDGGFYNDGINIAAPKGAPVAAAAAGTVAYVGDDLKSYGRLVLIRHAGGMMTAYAHLSTVKVRKGQAVRRGQVIGAVGSTGSVSSSQLHFEIRHGSKTHDPKQYLG